MTTGQVRAIVPFDRPGAAPLKVHLVHPRRVGSKTQLAIVMHGVLRDAGEYLEEWVDWAAQADYVVACPCFDAGGWPGGRSYSLGNVFARGGGRGPRRPQPAWAFTAVEALADHLGEALGLQDRRFDLWGHSAGAQFVHRFPLFRAAAPVRRLIAAGAGWYTLPDLDREFPYGLDHPLLGIGGGEAREWTARPLTLMRGTLDVVRDPHLRRTPEAEAQGVTRYERAGRMLAAARELDPRTRWRLVDVEGAAHDHLEMALGAQQRWDELLAEPVPGGCLPPAAVTRPRGAVAAASPRP